LAHARNDADADETPADIHRSVLLDAPLMLLQYLIAGPGQSEMDEMATDADGGPQDFPARSDRLSPGDNSGGAASVFEQLTSKSLNEEGKRVAVLCHATADVQKEHPAFHVNVIEDLSRRFKAGKISVVEAEKVVSWAKDRTGLTADSDLTLLGAEHEADFIVQFHIESLGFTEENFPELRRGRARGQVAVVEVTVDESGQKRSRVIFKQPFESKYPIGAPIAADAEEADAFKLRYLARLHYELSRLFLANP
jgi:hypothetical protein